jgi:polar amino acid transport system substrate-binding protein
MQKTHAPVSRHHSARFGRALTLTLGVLCAAVAWAQAPADKPSSAWADPQAVKRAPAADTAPPILRPPAVDTLATVRQRGLLRVGIVQVAPMVMQDRSNNYVGFSVDVARRLASDLGVRVEFVETWWTEVIPQLIDGHSDVIITGLWMNVPRALVANFTQPTASEGIYLIGSLPRAKQRRSLEAFNQPGVTIAVSNDPSQHAVAKARFPRATVTPVDDDPLIVVTEGRAHAAVVATLSADAVVASAPLRWFLPSPEPLASTSAGMAVRKGDPDFLAFLNAWIAIQRESGWLAERTRHWATSKEGFR